MKGNTNIKSLPTLTLCTLCLCGIYFPPQNLCGGVLVVCVISLEGLLDPRQLLRSRGSSPHERVKINDMNH